MTASAKHRAIELLWIVGAAAVSLIIVSGAIELSANILDVSVNGVMETGVAVLAAVGGGAVGLQSFNKRKGGES